MLESANIMSEDTLNINSNLIAELKLAPEELVCPKSGRQLEFVCTKKESKLCLDRLCCSKCIITDYADHFQWMTVLEDFFLPNTPKTSSDMKPSQRKEIENFLEKKEEMTRSYEQKVDKDATLMRDNLGILRQKITAEITKLENTVKNQRESFLKEFHGNYEELAKALNPPKDLEGQLTINDMSELQNFLEQRVKAENDKQEMKLERVFENLNDNINCLSLMQSNERRGTTIIEVLDKLIAFGTFDRFGFFKRNSQLHLSQLDFHKLTSKQTINTGNKKISKIVLINSEKQVAVCSDDETITIWDVATSQLSQTLTGHTERTLTVIQLRDGSLASGGCDNKIKIWNVTKGTCELELTGHKGHITSLIELPQLTLLSGSKDKNVRVWELKNKEKPQKSVLVDPKQNQVLCMTLLSHEEIAVSSEKDINVIIFDEMSIKKTLIGHTSNVRDLVLVERGDGNKLLSCSEDKTIKLWDLEKYMVVKTFSGHKGIVTKLLMFNRDVFMSGSEDSTLKFFHLDEEESVETVTAHAPAVADATILKDGTLVTCGTDKNIKFWSE